MTSFDSDGNSGWNMALIAAVSKKPSKTKTISEEKRIEDVKECLDEDADIDTVDKNGNTALHWAVEGGYPMVAEFLWKNKARTDIPNRNGHTAIMLATALGRRDIICTLDEPSTSRNSDLSSHNPSLNPSLNSTIRNRTAVVQDSSFDGSLSEMGSIDTSQADLQRDVMSDEQRSNRERIAGDEPIEHTKRQGRMTATKEPHNTSSGLKQSFHGYDYQLLLLINIMYRVRELKHPFQLATEMREAGKFDDIVLRSEDSNGDLRYRLLQVKHRENEKLGKWTRMVEDEVGQEVEQVSGITAKDLTQKEKKNKDFSLLHYFISWREIKRNATFVPNKSKDFILYTNVDLEVNDLKKSNITVIPETGTDNLLNPINVTNSEKQPRRYKLQIDNPSAMWKTLRTKSGGKVTDDEILRFLDEFILAVNQPNVIELGEIIERDIRAEFNLLEADIVSDSFRMELFNWFKTKKGVWLTRVHADEFFTKIRGDLDAIKTSGVSEVHMKKLEELGIQFNSVNTEIQNFIDRPNNGSKQLLKIISKKQTLLTALQDFQTLAKRQEAYKNEIVTFVPVEALSGRSPLVSGILKGSANRNLLIVDCESTNAKQKLQSLWDPIRKIMAENVHSKMILITQGDEDLGSECQLDCETCRVNDTEYSFENLIKESQKKLLGKRVTKFQGKKISTNFAKLLDIQDLDNLRKDELNDLSSMDVESLVRLISETELQIGCELHGLEDVGDYYVSRTIFRRVVIKEDILKDKKIPDLLAISGIDGKLFGETNFNTLARNEEKEQFDALCKKHKDRNVHWLKKEQEKYIWEKSQGSITYLMQHKDDRESIHINEMTGVTDFNENHLTAQNEPVIISDTAGMGKSTMLTYLASEMKENEHDMLVLKINLTHFSTALAEVKKTPRYDLVSIDGAIEFLVEKLLSDENNFSRKVFKRIIKRNHNVALIFDGFDEISPTYEKTVIDMLEALANYGIRKLLVATRPHTKRLLEAKLNAFSYEIRPFSTDDQERFLTSFWTTKFENSHHYLNPTDEDRIRKYTVAIIRTLADSIKDRSNEFTGIPLQTKLVAEIFERHNEGERENFDSCQDFIASKDDEPKFPKKINLVYLYDHFVRKKFEIFFEKRGGNLADVGVLEDKEPRYQSYIAKHEKLALDTLFNRGQVEKLQLSQRGSSYGSPDSTDLKIPIERDGIITQFIVGQPRFGHQTYAEYFAATFFSKNLKEREPDESFGKILVAHVLLEKRYETMRAFINWLLSDEYSDALQGEFWTLFVKEHRSQSKETIFHLAAAEGNNRIMRIFLNCFRVNQEDRKAIIHVRDSADRTAVDRAIKYGHLDTIKLLAEDTDFEINCQDAVGFTPLYQAVKMSTLDVVRYFIDKGADVNLPTNDGETPLYTAALYRKWETVKYLLEKGANINSRTTSGSTLLHLVAREGKSDIADYLLEKGADVNLPTNDGETPLYTAVQYGRLKMVKYLLKKGADINFRTKSGLTLLHVAAHRGKLNIADYLLEKGADVNLPTNDGETPLYTAAESGQLEMVEYLLEKGANINSQTYDGETLLHVVARVGKLDIADYLLEKGADVNLPTNDGKTPLYTAALYRKWEMFNYLLEKGANINSRTTSGSTLLHLVARGGKSDIADYLLEKGADVNLPTNDGETPLYTAAESGQLEMVEYLLEKGANINSQTNDGETLLHVVARVGKLDIADYLLEKGADVNLPTNDGKTPLYTAALYRKWEMFNYLLEKGANINSRTTSGRTLLHLVARGGKSDIADYLLEKGADVNLPTNDGVTPLHTAALYRKWAMFNYLLEKGANINSRTTSGSTLLHLVARGGKSDIADYLLEKGADVNLRTNDGETPLYTAAQHRQSEMFNYLLEKGAKTSSRTTSGSTLLRAAVYGGKSDIADYLLEKGADVNLPTNDGVTPLYTAALGGEWEMVKYLLEKGANINSRTTSGSTLLHLVARQGKSDIADYLLEKGADVNLPTNDGKTPLYTAALYRKWEMFNYLLEKGANINSRTTSGSTLLHLVARGGKSDIADYLLEKGADVNLPTNDGKTPLYTAALYRKWEMFNYLLEKGANINSRTTSGSTLLHAATCVGKSDIADYFLEKGADVNLPTNDGVTPMYTAARGGEWEMVKYLLEKGANINSRTTSGSTLLHLVTRGGESDIADYLLEKGADVNLPRNDGETPLYTAALFRKWEMFNYLLEKGANINSRTTSGSTLLHAAACGGKSDIADYLLEKGADVNLPTNDGETPLYTAAQHGHSEMFNHLLEKGANINSRTTSGSTLLHAAAWGGKSDIADYLLEKGADVNLPTNDGETPLYTAAQHGHSEMFNHLLEKGANINSRTTSGSTLLHAAAWRGKSDIADYLLEKGADVNLPTNDGETPLYTAAQHGHSEMFNHLLEKGANINSRTTSGSTLLHAAVCGLRSDIADYLLEMGADVNLPTNDGETPLYTAAESGQLEMVEYLVENGANIDSQSNEGWTALDVATDMGHKDVVKYLLGIGATGNSLPTEG